MRRHEARSTCCQIVTPVPLGPQMHQGGSRAAATGTLSCNPCDAPVPSVTCNYRLEISFALLEILKIIFSFTEIQTPCNICMKQK